MNLIIVESPAKCKKIESILGKNYKCIASFGHITELNELELIDFNNFEDNKYKIIKTKQKYINNLKNNIINTIKLNGNIIIATDNDREGEAIGYHICKLFNLSIENTERIIFNEITKPSILNSINNPTKLNLDIIHSQQSRQILDLCVGFKISPILWKYVNYKSSAGRCQTPTLKLIKEQENTVKEYFKKPEFLWKIIGNFGKYNWLFNLNNYNDILKEKNNIINFLELCKDFNFICKKNDEKHENRYPPLPLITSTLQQKSNQIFGFTSKTTMKIAQDLYEKGLITYMRTDSTSMSMEFIKKCEKYINNNYGSDFVSSNFNDRNKNKSKQKSQEAHECIRVTDPNVCTIENDENHKKIYKLIWKISLQTIMKPSIYKKNTLDINSPIENIYFNKHFYLNHFKGFEIIDFNNENHETNLQQYNYINHFVFNSNNNEVNINNNNIECNNCISKYPKLLNESDVIKNIEKLNIGRPSTFSTIVQNIESKGFVSKEKKQLLEKYNQTNIKLENKIIDETIEEKEILEFNKYKVSEKGEKIIEFCNKYFNDFFNYNFTNMMEKDLDLIANGDKDKKSICKDFNNTLDDLINNFNNNEIEEKNEYKISFKQNRINLGKYDKKSIYLCNGKYGYFLEYNKNKFSIQDNNVDLDKAINIINNKKNEVNKSVLRDINEDITIRESKFGKYIFFKTKTMKKPIFISLDSFDDNILLCDTKKIIDYVENNKNKTKKNYRKKYNK